MRMHINDNNKSKNVKKKSLTTPYSPQAAIAAGRAKCEVSNALSKKLCCSN